MVAVYFLFIVPSAVVVCTPILRVVAELASMVVRYFNLLTRSTVVVATLVLCVAVEATSAMVGYSVALINFVVEVISPLPLTAPSLLTLLACEVTNVKSNFYDF